MLESIKSDSVGWDVKSFEVVASEAHLAFGDVTEGCLNVSVSSLTTEEVQKFRGFPTWRATDLKSVSAIQDSHSLVIDLAICSEDA